MPETRNACSQYHQGRNRLLMSSMIKQFRSRWEQHLSAERPIIRIIIKAANHCRKLFVMIRSESPHIHQQINSKLLPASTPNKTMMRRFFEHFLLFFIFYNFYLFLLQLAPSILHLLLARSLVNSCSGTRFFCSS